MLAFFREGQKTECGSKRKVGFKCFWGLLILHKGSRKQPQPTSTGQGASMPPRSHSGMLCPVFSLCFIYYVFCEVNDADNRMSTLELTLYISALYAYYCSHGYITEYAGVGCFNFVPEPLSVSVKPFLMYIQVQV